MGGDNHLWQTDCRYDTYGEVTGSTTGTALTVSSTNTKGGWQQLSSSTAFPAEGLLVTADLGTAGSPQALIDIGIGAASSERVVVPNLAFSSRLGHPQSIWLPVAIPSGSRLAARCQCNSTTNVPRIVVTIMGTNPSGLSGFGRMTAYGVDTSDSGATVVDPGASANTKGSWTQIVASTTNECRMLLIAITARGNSAMVDAGWLFDFGIGSGGSERILVPDQYAGAQTASDVVTPSFIGPLPVSIAASTRLAARSQCSSTDATDRLLDVAMYGFD